MGPCFRRGDVVVGVVPKTGYACAAFTEDILLDSRQRELTALRRVRTDTRAGCDHFAGAALAAEARRVPPDAVAAGQPAAPGSGRCPISGRVVSILSPGQRHRARRVAQSRLQSRG